MATPLGKLSIEVDDSGALVRVHFGECDAGSEEPVAPSILERFAAYFAGELDALAALPQAPRGTEFQVRVWREVAKIPAGKTESYGELARRSGDAGLSRAVGAANGANPLLLVIPCHRVIGAGGEVRGYAAGIDRKEWLLQHEGALWSQQSLLTST
jgi:methylated-DNA-[protein]-cysteine S-methyltransferase